MQKKNKHCDVDSESDPMNTTKYDTNRNCSHLFSRFSIVAVHRHVKNVEYVHKLPFFFAGFLPVIGRLHLARYAQNVTQIMSIFFRDID